MPLASSRSASLKRAQALEAEQKERKRMRKSLPSTFPSSLSVDETKTRQSRARRASLSKQAPEDDANGPNSENEKPNAVRQGPTPYWKVRSLEDGRCANCAVTENSDLHFLLKYLL